MQPGKRITSVKIPLTFDGAYKNKGLTNDKFITSAVLLIIWLALSILLLIKAVGSAKIIYPLVLFVIITTFIRVILMREHFYKKKREELREKDYKFDYNIFWNIYEVSVSYPHICRYVNGLKSIFVVLDKDVIVGREDDNDYYHYEAITEAYLQMYKRGIDCMHIDYMDTVGKDERMESLFDMANKADNSDLREVLVRVFDNVSDTMNRSYASYDVYCFMFQGKDEVFWDELQEVLGYFCQGNYIRARVLGKEELGELVKSLMNIDKFSVNATSERLFSDIGGVNYIRPIWVERGKERKILNKTSEEIDELNQIKQVEREVKKGLKRSRKDRKKRMMQDMIDHEDINLFDD